MGACMTILQEQVGVMIYLCITYEEGICEVFAVSY
jgi:hypothetical protein